MTSFALRNLSPLLAFALGACHFGVDPSLIDDEPNEPIPDAGADASPDPEPDAGDAACTGSDCIDAGPWGCEGSECDDGDGSTPMTPTACTSDAACDAEQYCSHVSKRCEARCNDDLGCAGPAVVALRGIVAGSGVVAWSAEPMLDDFGNATDQGSVWIWDGLAAPRKLLDEKQRLVSIYDDVLYLMQSEGGIAGVPLSGTGDRQVLERATRMWATREFVWWSALGAVEGSELWRKPRAGGPAEMLGTAAHDGWHTGTKDMVARTVELERFYLSPVDDLSVVTPTQTYLDHFVVADETHMYTAGLPAYITRFDPHRPNESTLIGRSDEEADFSSVQFSGDWVYWMMAGDGRYVAFGRTPGLGKPVVMDYLTLPNIDGWYPWDILRNAFVYHHEQEQRIFTKQFPPRACSEALPCSDGLRCDAGFCL